MGNHRQIPAKPNPDHQTRFGGFFVFRACNGLGAPGLPNDHKRTPSPLYGRVALLPPKIPIVTHHHGGCRHGKRICEATYRLGHHTAAASSSGLRAATAIIGCSSNHARPWKATVTPSEDSDWQKLSDQVQRALSAGWSNSGMPATASALYSRWWQLETWLRSLVYLELRSAMGSAWADVLPVNSADRQQKDEEYRHMRTPDAQDRLAYLDAGPLLQLTVDQWQLFRFYLPAQKIWAGRIEELKAIRNRIGHCRRPHSDDLDRLEQTLRDLDGGAFLAMSSFNDQLQPNQEWSDVLVRDWIHQEHSEASLIDHARKQYDTSFRLSISRRPWAEPLARNEEQLGNRPGYVWHACWYFRGGRPFNLSKFWRDIEFNKDPIMLVCADTPSSLRVSFSAMEDQRQVSDVIGRSFDAALTTLSLHPGNDDYIEWARRYSNVDPRVHAGTPWAAVEPSMEGVSIFSA
ncbi:Swt1 family HEPN domain-containing protein [Paraburkholderia sp. BR10882]|uniref:Swt1 family HEPN domain-containing protein n=1 Tax=unclassified Paraburkholderia TaxID=2615204 RepID=UPI0034D003B2